MPTIVDRDPATGEVIAELPAATPDQVHAAVARARAAQPAWAALDLDTRVERLVAFGPLLESRADELARLVTREMGKPLADARREVAGWVSHTPALLAEVAAAVAPRTEREGAYEHVLHHEPHGVVAVITPWNYPVAMALQLLLPALATGNAVVFKPSEHVPLTGALLAELLASLVPPHTIELLHGAGEVGAELVAADVDMIGFVGSRETGMRIMESASRSLKRLVLELGGKDPLVVFADADLEAAAECAVRHSLRNAGQVCCSVERVYVAEPIREAFEDLVLLKAKDWHHGPGTSEEARMGPLVSAEQRRRVEEHVADAVGHGARLLCGGETPDGPGYFYPATVLADVPLDCRAAHEETFGPVVALTAFSGDEEEAVRLANDTSFGLGANVFTADLERGRRMARRIHAGQVGINRYLAGASGFPWVGARQSGFGYLGGPDGHRQFTVPKSVAYPVSGGSSLAPSAARARASRRLPGTSECFLAVWHPHGARVRRIASEIRPADPAEPTSAPSPWQWA